MNHTGTLPEDLRVDGGKLSALISLVLAGKINRNSYKEAARAVFMEDVEPEAYIAEKGLFMLSDDTVVADTVTEVLRENADAVADYRAGKDKAFGFLMGQVMKKLKGAGNPGLVRQTLQDLLEEKRWF